MNYEAISKVSAAFKARVLQAYAAAGGIDEGVYVGPLSDPDAAGAKLILFLYRLAPNPSLRSKEHSVPSDDPAKALVVFRNSLPLDLYYLLTVGDASDGKTDLEQLKFLGSAIDQLHRNPLLGGLPVDHEAAKVTLDPLSNEEMNRIWALFPTANYRTSVAYFVSPVWIDPPLNLEPAAAAPVADDALMAGVRDGSQP